MLFLPGSTFIVENYKYTLLSSSIYFKCYYKITAVKNSKFAIEITNNDIINFNDYDYDKKLAIIGALRDVFTIAYDRVLYRYLTYQSLLKTANYKLRFNANEMAILAKNYPHWAGLHKDRNNYNKHYGFTRFSKNIAICFDLAILNLETKEIYEISTSNLDSDEKRTENIMTYSLVSKYLVKLQSRIRTNEYLPKLKD